MTVAHWYKTDVSVIYKVKGSPPEKAQAHAIRPDRSGPPPTSFFLFIYFFFPTAWTISALSVTEKFAPLYFEGSFFRCCHNAVRA